jgi:hypothetical protein
MAVIAFETDGSFDHRFRNPVNETFGLIQFTPELARRLGTSMEDLGQGQLRAAVTLYRSAARQPR